MSNLLPKQLSKKELLSILSDLHDGVMTGDTLEGNIAFTISDKPNKWDVHGVYRVGNLMGQGGVRMIGTVPDPPDPDPD